MTFVGAQGHKLAALLEVPKGKEPKAYLLFAHCFTCGKDVLSAKYISAALVRAGLAVLRFDFTGLGSSEGEFTNTNFSSNIDDLLAAADHLRSHYKAPACLVGHSLGGTAALAAAAKIPECRAVASIGSPFDPIHVLRQFHADLSRIQEHGEADVMLAGRTFRIQKKFIDDLATFGSEHISALNRPLLVCHSPSDEVVGIENAARIFAASKHPKSFISLDNATHLLSNRKDADYVGSVISTWALRYILS